jgi:hypothetical protein
MRSVGVWYMGRGATWIVVSGLTFLFAPRGVAQELELEGREAMEDEEHPRNEVASFAGFIRYEDDNYNTLGFDYQHRFGETFGLGVLLNWSPARDESLQIGVPLSYNPRGVRGLRWTAAAGLHMETAAFLRFGVAYRLGFERLIVAPGVNWDILSGSDAIVYGVSVGVGF